MPLHDTEAPGYLLRTLDQLADDQIRDAYTLYRTCMEPLEILTAQKHLMDEGDFKAMMLDERIIKALVLDEAGEILTFGTYTTDITALPLLAWQFYRHNWPDEYDRDAIIYVPFIVSGGQHRAYRTFVEHIYSLAAPLRGLVAVDVCDYNEGEHHFVDAIAITTRRLSHGKSRHYQVAYQGYWIYDVTGMATDPFTGRAHEPAPANGDDLAQLEGGVFV
jgi:hypothetical protein